MRLAGKTALVTGAATGLGRAIAEEFAAHGAAVILSDRDADRLRLATDEMASQGRQVHAAGADVTKADDIAALAEAARAISPALDILVNNAGISKRGDFRHQPDSDWDEIIDINLKGIIRCSRDLLPLLREAENASVINMSSIMGGRHIRQLSAYSTTKAAVGGLTRAMAVEYAAFGIRVNALCPGYAETELTRQVLRNPDVRKALLMQTPMGRFTRPEDVAKAALFLASDESAFVTGIDLVVDGGMSVAL
ncbi:MAG: 3-oxoacyl-[acyl-carrier-protein] reductase [Methyloligellaceae bacterium]